MGEVCLDVHCRKMLLAAESRDDQNVSFWTTAKEKSELGHCDQGQM